MEFVSRAQPSADSSSIPGHLEGASAACLARLLTRQVLSPMLDPVVRAKIQMTKSNADLQVHIPPEHLIKEVRAVTDLGLKEAKELVEKAPVVVRTGLPKEEAEALAAKLKAAGAAVALE